jgi:Peptidase family M1 domain
MRTLAVCLSFVFLCFSAIAADAPRVAGLAESFDNPTLGPSSAVSNATVKLSDRMTVTLAGGHAAPVLSGKDVIGLFFTGNGSLSYRADDKAEAVNVKFNAKKASDFKLTEGADANVLQTDFKQFYLRAANIKLPELTGTGEPLTQQFTDFRAELKQRNTPATHLLIKQRLDNPSASVAVAEFIGGQNALYVLDTIETRTEYLFALRRENRMSVRELAGYWWPVEISAIPVGRQRRAFTEPLYLLTDLDYTLVDKEKENVEMTVTETIMPRIAPQSVFRFDLYSNVFDSNGKARHYNVRSVTDAAGKELSFDHKNDSIIVGLPNKAGVNQPFKLTFKYDGDFLFNQGAYLAWQLGTAPWFPQPDLNGQYYTIHSTVKVKKPNVAFAPGTTIRKVDEGDYTVYETRIDKPVQFGVVHGGRYHVDEEVYDGGNLTVRVASYALNNPRAMKQLSNLAWKMIKNYEPWLGPFPFKEFNIIEIPELGFAQAPPGTMFITKEAFNPTMGEDNKAFSRGINERFAHEIAHQYWGHVVKMGSGEEQWVTESFAEYSSALLMKNLKKGAYDSMLAHWKANAGMATEVSSIPLANRIRIASDPGAGFRHRTYLIYDKGAYLLAAIHKQLGEDKFLTFLRSLQGIFAWQYLTTPDMARLLQRIDGKDWMPFFEEDYYGTGMPKM